MKKTYQKPSIKVRKIETDCLLGAQSPTVGGNTGITIGEGEPPTSGGAKGNNFFDFGSEPSSSSTIDWDE